MAATLAPGPKSRLRRACDGCSAAKVKCDRKDAAATCERCQFNEMPCTYSLSRRYGKQSWAKRVAYEQAQAQAQVQAAGARPETKTGTDDAFAPRLGQQQPPGSGAPTAAPSAAGTASRNHSVDETAWPTGGHGGFHRLGEPAFDLSQFWNEDGFAADFDMATVLDMPLVYPHGEPPVPPESLRPGTSKERPPVCVEAMASPQQQCPVLLPLRCRRHPPGPDAVLNTHSCESQALAMLQALQHCSASAAAMQSESTGHSPLSWSQQSEATAASMPGTPGAAPSLDEVLLVNKAALANFLQLMACTCTKMPHLGFLYLSILSKILYWYRAAATGHCALRPTQIKMGMLELDDEDQANLRRVIILRELCKVETTIKSLVSMNVDPASAGEALGGDNDDREDGAASAGHPGKWFVLGVAKIQAELQETTGLVEQISHK